MLLLKKLDWCPYWTIASMDSPQRGASETDKFQNTIEAASIIDPFELVFQEVVLKLNRQGITGLEIHQAEQVLKPLYQALRHGLAFDWVVNSCIAIMVEHFPFTYHKQFKGTQPFIDQFTEDEVFQDEVDRLHGLTHTVLDWVFEGYPDRSVYKRMSAYSKSTNVVEAYQYSVDYPPLEPFEIPILTADRINYLVLLMEMLTVCIGRFNRVVWTNRIQQIKQSAPGHEDLVAIVGGKFNAFAYGDIYDTGIAKWTRLSSGIQISAQMTRVDRTDIVRIIPDEMTFFWFTDMALIIDESLYPTVQFELEQGFTNWINPREFRDFKGLILDTPIKMRLKYDFPQNSANPKTISLKGDTNTLIKDRYVVLNDQGIAETQIVFRGNVIGFKIADPEKKYPFTFFTSKNIESSDTFAWLE